MKQPTQASIETFANIHQYTRAQDLSLLVCHCCGVLNPSHSEGNEDVRCQRCASKLHQRKPNSLSRTFALALAATILYIPANLFPMTIMTSILGNQQDTILTGVIYFWTDGDYLVAAVIFCASIFIPLLKLLILFFLLAVVHLQKIRKIHFSPKRCAKLYRLVELVGRWSMIDVFVVSLLTALIQMQSLATIIAGPGAVAFASVVVLTLFASLSFDPRIIWDNYFQAIHHKHLTENTNEKLTLIE